MKDPADPAYVRAGALRARDSRRGAAGQHDGRARGDRRDRVRAAADPRLRAGRARRFVQAARAGRHAAGAGDRRRQGPRDPDAPELDPGAPRRAPHLRRLPQPAPRRGAELRPAGRSGQSPGRVAADAWRRAPVGRDDGRDAHPPRPERAEAAGRHGVHRRLGRHGQAGVAARAVDRDPLHRQRQRGRRPGDAVPVNGIINYPSTSRRSGRATAAPTPAPTATPTRRELDLRATHRRAPAASRRTRN